MEQFARRRFVPFPCEDRTKLAGTLDVRGSDTDGPEFPAWRAASRQCAPQIQSAQRQERHRPLAREELRDQARRNEHGSLLPGVSALLSRCSTSGLLLSRVPGPRQSQCEDTQTSDNHTRFAFAGQCRSSCAGNDILTWTPATDTRPRLSESDSRGTMHRDVQSVRHYDLWMLEHSRASISNREVAETRDTLSSRITRKRHSPSGYINDEDVISINNYNRNDTTRAIVPGSDCSQPEVSRHQQQSQYPQQIEQSTQPQDNALPPIPATKSSRYLREMDRREILNRIARGEKQSALAKEFRVSRAAICNLNKHRDEVLSRTDENPFAKHPKKPRLAKQQERPATSSAYFTDHNALFKTNVEPNRAPRIQVPAAPKPDAVPTMKDTNSRVFEIKSRSTALLLTMARARNASISDFQCYTDRIIRLVVEHALALAPVNRINDTSDLGDSTTTCSSEYPPCGIVVHPSGIPMLDIFRNMKPTQPVDIVVKKSDSPSGLSPSSKLPRDFAHYNVFVFDVAIQDASIEALVETVTLLKQHDAAESMIWIVGLSISSHSIVKLHSKFPQLKIVAANIRDRAPLNEGMQDPKSTTSRLRSPTHNRARWCSWTD